MYNRVAVCRLAETVMDVTFRSGVEIDQGEACVSILKRYWKAFAPRSVHEWSERIANSGRYIVAAYVGDVIAAVLEGMRLDLEGDPNRVPKTFQELTGDGTWKTHSHSGDTVMLVDLPIAPDHHGVGLVEAASARARAHVKWRASAL